MKKTIKRCLIVSIFFILAIALGNIDSKAGNLYLNSLDFQTQINSDGSMNVIETWNIDIKFTNTLYKSFKTDSRKYSKITNVLVKDITSGQNKTLHKTEEWAYHVKKDYYYGTKNEDGDFEIGWGVGLDHGSAVKTYQISYKVNDAIKKANDCAELYWQFVGEDFEIDARNITGTIYLPSNVLNKEDIKVWGHTEGLNGTIYATDTNKIEFQINDFENGTYVEVRTLFPTELINYSGRNTKNDILQGVISEETKWANEANAKRARANIIRTLLIILVVIGNIILAIFFLKKTIKYIKKYIQIKRLKPTVNVEYFREMPNENTTPGEAFRITKDNINQFTPTNYGKIFSATLLDLALKGYIEIEKNIKNEKEINIKILKDTDYKIKKDEKEVFEIIQKASINKESISLKELEKYIKNHPSEIQELLSNTYKEITKNLLQEKIIDEEGYKEYQKYKNNRDYYLVAVVFFAILTTIFFICPIVIFIINAILCNMIAKKIDVLTQKGVDQKEQWKGLKKYMENFSLLNEREVPELAIWEKYLVFATVFGVADKVIKQLKMVYPNIDEMTTVGSYTYINVMATTNFSSVFTNAISSSISSSYSSGSGGGGGFSGGGGGGRWPEAAVAGR